MKIGLFYGSTTCYTEMSAEKIQAAFNEGEIELHNLKDVPLSNCLSYDILMFGISTWDYGELQEDWEAQWEDLHDINLEGKIIALYGMGDQIGYTDWFQDALGMLHQVVTENGGYTVGYWPNEGYEFAASKALTEDKTQFIGLALDEDNQYDLTESRIEQWCQQVKNEINEILTA